MWTRNYNNLLNTAVTTISEGYNGESPRPFGDTYTGNYKNPLGNIFEICTFTANVYLARAPFVYRKNAAGCPVAAEVSMLKNTQNSLMNDDGWQKGKIFVALGASNDPESYEDYMIEDVISSFILNSATATVTENDDGTLTVSYRIMITATAEFTAKEIGIFLPIAYYNNNTSGRAYSYYALINRMVLDEPITAVTDEVVHVNFSLTPPKISVNG